MRPPHRILDAALRSMPGSALEKTRLAAMVVGCLSLLVRSTQVGNGTRSDTWLAASMAAIAILAVILLLSYLRGRVPWWEPLVLPGLVFVAGAGLIDSMSTIALSISVLVPQSLYGSTRAWILRTMGGIVAIPVAVAVSPLAIDRPISWNAPTIVGVLPQLVLVCLMMRGIYAVLRRQERAEGREAALARAGGRLLGCPDLDSVWAVRDKSAQELVALSPGVAAVVLERQPEGLRVKSCAGLESTVVGAIVDNAAIGVPIDAEQSSGPVDVRLLAGLARGLRYWHAIALGTDRYLLVGGARPVAADVIDAFRTLGHQVALGEANRQSHAELQHSAHHDHLTQLPTRALFFRRLAAAVDLGPPGRVALLNIDLDDFKQVNDVYGHSAGDELLVEVAERLNEVCGPHAVAARFGGDEFAILLTDLDDPAEAERIAASVCARIVVPMQLTAAIVSVGASIGVAVSEAGVSATDLIRCADIAMYSAKARGKNRVERFLAEQHGSIARNRMLENHVSEAARRDEITLVFQPYLDVGTGAVAGVEAIAGWRHPTLGLLSSGQLLALAERTGALPMVGTHILRTACQQVAALPGDESLPFGINIVARQLLDPAFADAVGAALTEFGLSPQRLILEIVESEQIDEPVAGAQLHRLSELGVNIALDDFGTGYVSFASLRSYPIHQLKVDQHFLFSGDAPALDLVLSVGKVLGTQTIVQGVTSAAQVARLRQTPATALQGDLLARPMPAADLAAWLTAGPSSALWPALHNA